MRTTCVLSLLIFCGVVQSAPKPLDYNRDVRPILSDKCFYCHGPGSEHREADLRLDIEDAAKDSAVVAGEPSDSEAYLRIISDDDELRMPPPESGKTLTSSEIEIIQRWITEGAVYDEYWAYVPPKHHANPNVEKRDWPVNWIDLFILARHEQEGLQSVGDANRITLARRLSFDLTGLPPSIEDVQRMVEDSSEVAYERYVDELLSSPHFGERLAAYWLDLVRFADTVGYHGDQDHSISPYRDYVIDAMNASMPFAQFTREQLAGDLIPGAGIQQSIASGYNRLLQTSHEGGVQPKEYLAMYAADRIRNLSGVWMGATVGCAQCHDHKYDPYTIKDFYALSAFFADIDEAQHFSSGSNTLPTNRAPEIRIYTQEQQARLDDMQAEIKEQQSDESEAGVARLKELQARYAAFQKTGRKTMVTATVKPRTVRVLPRGNWLDNTGEIVEPAIPEFLGPIDSNGERPNRLDLARWLTEESGGGALTARVMVNRIWYLLMGVGISKSLDDFGGQGQPPEHPELLDRLALEFIRTNMDLKSLIRQIVLSRTYRQSSEASNALVTKDPYNRLYARQSRHRLPAESIRDNALAVSGLLVRQCGGDSVKPYQPEGYYRHLNFPKRRYIQHDDRRQWRRGLYVHWQRQFLHPMMKAFDAPSREECTAERPRSNTPLAALVLLNDPSFVEAARTFAARILCEPAADDFARLEAAFSAALSRPSDPTERSILMRVLQANRQHFQKDQAAVNEFLSVGLAPLPPNLDHVELAAWTMVTRAILNMDEAITRN